MDSRLKAYRKWLTMTEPTWAKLSYEPVDYQDLYYYSAPKQAVKPKSLDEVDPKLLETYNKLGIPLKEQEVLAGVVAVDAVFDSVSVATTYKAQLRKQGIIFCSISEAIKEHPDLVRKYLGSVVPYTDNFSQLSIRPFLPTVRLCIFPKGSNARWSFLLISASTQKYRTV